MPLWQSLTRTYLEHLFRGRTRACEKAWSNLTAALIEQSPVGVALTAACCRFSCADACGICGGEAAF